MHRFVRLLLFVLMGVLPLCALLAWGVYRHTEGNRVGDEAPDGGRAVPVSQAGENASGGRENLSRRAFPDICAGDVAGFSAADGDAVGRGHSGDGLRWGCAPAAGGAGAAGTDAGAGMPRAVMGVSPGNPRPQRHARAGGAAGDGGRAGEGAGQ